MINPRAEDKPKDLEAQKAIWASQEWAIAGLVGFRVSKDKAKILSINKINCVTYLYDN